MQIVNFNKQAAGRYYDLSQLGNTTDIIDSLILMILSSSWEELPHVRFSLQVDLNVTEFLDWYIRMIFHISFLNPFVDLVQNGQGSSDQER